MVQVRGQLVLSSYETAPECRPKLQNLQLQGVDVAVVCDEVLCFCCRMIAATSIVMQIHELGNSKEFEKYRDFRNFWTLIAALQPTLVTTHSRHPPSSHSTTSSHPRAGGRSYCDTATTSRSYDGHCVRTCVVGCSSTRILRTTSSAIKLPHLSG